MAIFEYKAVYQRQTIRDSMTAANVEDARTVLKTKGYKVVWLKEIRAKDGRGKGKKVSVLERANFCRYLATMIDAGMPLTEAVEVYAQDTTNKAFKPVLVDVLASLEKGQTLSLSFSRHPQVFDALFISLIKAGEASGTLSQSFDYLGKQLFADYDLRRKVKGAMMYPAIVVTVMGFILVLIVFFVLPKIAPIFLQMSFELPTFTKIIFKVGVWVAGHKAILALIGIGFLIAGFVFVKWKRGRKIVYRGLAAVPQVGRLIDNLDLARFCRIFSTLLKSGVPINEAVVLVFTSLSQAKYQDLAEEFESEIKKGNQLSQIVRSRKVFPRMLVRMITTGEKSGTTDKMLEYMASFYESEVENGLHDVTNLLEPVMMLIVGIGVGVLVISVIAPIYSLVGSLSI